jgi:Enoyl-CoA hydratase/isomerase
VQPLVHARHKSRVTRSEDFLKNPPGPGQSSQVRLMNALIDFDKPLIAAVRGAAIGGGTTMLTHCELRDAARCPLWFKTGKTHREHLLSALAPIADLKADGSELARAFFTFAGLVGAARCSAFLRGSHDRWP